MELKDLWGKHILQGVELGNIDYGNGGFDVQYVKFALDGITYIAKEDAADGYRSYCRELLTSDEPCKVYLPNIDVVCVPKYEVGNHYRCDILEFIDCNNGKTVLLVGTDYTDDYYPFCVFEYTPENLSCNE